MNWQEIDWDIPLHACPSIAATDGWAILGRTGVEHYRLNRIWCLNLYDGEGELHIAGHVFPIRPGYASITVPDEEMQYHYKGPAILAWAHFYPAVTSGRERIPVMQDVGEKFVQIREGLREAAAVFPAEPVRAAARLWDILWSLTRRPETTVSPSPPHPGLRLALDTLHADMARPVCVSELARRTGLSQTHLNRLFREKFGETVTGYVRRRRVEWAEHLLRHTTLQIKAIAAQVGIPDPHLFNKTIRRALGKSPCQIRDEYARQMQNVPPQPKSPPTFIRR